MDRKSASKATSAAVISTAAQPEQLRSSAGGTSWQLTYVCACGGIVSGLPVTRFPLPAARCPLPARASEASCMCILLTLSAPTSDVYDDDVVLESVVLYG